MAHLLEDAELQEKFSKLAKETTDPVELFRAKCLQRGVNSIQRFGRTFRIFDDDANKSLNFEEFSKGVRDYGLEMSDEDKKEIFSRFDHDGAGSISFNEFIVALRGNMNADRIKIVEEAFKKADTTGDGVVTPADLKGVYNAKQHPKYTSGEMTEEEVFEQFLNKFEPNPELLDGKITLDEFKNYFSGISAAIDNDAHFELTMRAAWKI